MLAQAAVEDVKAGRLKSNDHIVIAMRHYPRGLKKPANSEYLQVLAPGDVLFKDFYKHKDDLGEDHNTAFEHCRYEKRFGLTSAGLAELQRLCELSKSKDVVLVCQCGPGERCHRELLLLLAQKWYGAKTAPLRFSYPFFEQRLERKPPANIAVDVAPNARGRGLEWPIPLRD
ncbi:MAG TPA: DUF488 family protein [Planctomycetota bacterium]|nr:DUF488 family protein [Planctomycetota bacterium]